LTSRMKRNSKVAFGQSLKVVATARVEEKGKGQDE